MRVRYMMEGGKMEYDANITLSHNFDPKLEILDVQAKLNPVVLFLSELS